MAQFYSTVTGYVWQARNQLQDMVGPPYRYTDDQIVGSLNHALAEMGRIRPDIFLDLKYQRPLRKGDLDEGMPNLYNTNDIAFLPDGVTYDTGNGTKVPVPVKYISPVQWFVSGYLQLYDVADTQDARGQAFITKFQTQLLTLTAA